MAYRHGFRVRFHEADPAGIAFFGRFFTWCHDAYEEMMRAGGLPLEDALHGDVVLPLSRTSAEFLRPLKHGAEATVVIRVAEVREKGYRLVHEILGPDGAPCARLETVHVAVSRQAGRPVPLPENVRALLASHVD